MRGVKQLARMLQEQRVRAYLYRVVTAVAVLAAFYGFVADQAVSLWVGLGAAVLGTGTAAANTPRH